MSIVASNVEWDHQDGYFTLGLDGDGGGGGALNWPLLAPDGSAAAPSYSFSDEPGTGLYRDPTGGPWGDPELRLKGGGTQSWDATYVGIVPPNPASAQASLSVRNQQNATNWAGLELNAWPMAGAYIMATVWGTPPYDVTSYPLTLGYSLSGTTYPALTIAPSGVTWLTNATPRWKVDLFGHFIAATDNTYDIGASGGSRPRDAYVARDVNVQRGLNARYANLSESAGVALYVAGYANLMGDLHVNGDATVVGRLELSWDPVSDMQAATKQYVDQEVAAAGGGGGLSWPLLAPDGTGQAPSYSFAGEPGTGISVPWPDALALSIYGWPLFSLSMDGGHAENRRADLYVAMFNVDVGLAAIQLIGPGPGAAFQFIAEYGFVNPVVQMDWSGLLVNGTLQFNGPVRFAPDNAYDIGAFNGSRPRDVFVAREIRAGTSVFASDVGTYASAAFGLMTGANRRWSLAAAGHFVAAVDNAYDIGALGARPRNLLLGGTATLGRDPTADMEAATKQYVDARASLQLRATLSGGRQNGLTTTTTTRYTFPAGQSTLTGGAGFTFTNQGLVLPQNGMYAITTVLVMGNFPVAQDLFTNVFGDSGLWATSYVYSRVAAWTQRSSFIGYFVAGSVIGIGAWSNTAQGGVTLDPSIEAVYLGNY